MVIHLSAEQLHYVSEKRMTPLMAAARWGGSKAFVSALAGSDSLEAVDSHGRTALFHAVRNEKTLMPLQMLIDSGANIEHRDNAQRTALDWACWKCSNPEAAHILLKADADFESSNYAGWTPVFYAAGNANPAIIKLLLSAGANATVRAANGRTALMNAAAFDAPIETLKLLLMHGTPLNVLDDAGFSALSYAVHRCSRMDERQRPRPDLSWATWRTKKVDWLLKAGADPSLCGSSARGNPLLLALRMDCPLSVIHTLVKNGAKIREPLPVADSVWIEPALSAAWRHRLPPPLFVDLVQAGAALDVVSPLGSLTVLGAVSRESRGVGHLTTLLDLKADPLSHNCRVSPLEIIRNRRWPVRLAMEPLILKAAAALHPHAPELTLCTACRQCDILHIYFRLKTHDNLNLPDFSGDSLTPLEICAGSGLDVGVDLLLKAGADPNTGNPLVQATLKGQLQTTRQLLDAQADPDGTGGSMTPLDAAVRRRSLPLVKLLLERHCHPRKSALKLQGLCELAEKNGDREILLLLLNELRDQKNIPFWAQSILERLDTPLFSESLHPETNGFSNEMSTPIFQDLLSLEPQPARVKIVPS